MLTPPTVLPLLRTGQEKDVQGDLPHTQKEFAKI